MSRGDVHLERAEPLRTALTALKQSTGLSALQLADHVSEQSATMTIKAPGGTAVKLPYAVKPHIDRRNQLSTFKYQHGNTVLVTRSLSNALMDECRQLNLQFLDASGNCFLNQPGLFVFVTGRRATTTTQTAVTRGLTPAALRCVFAVLAKPAILNASVRRIAEIAGISHGAAGIALAMLEETGLISKNVSGARVLLLPERWLDVWTEGYLGRLRPKLVTYRMSSPALLPELLGKVTTATREIMLGGEAAAAYADLGLKPGTLTLYVDLQHAHVMRGLVQELTLRRDDDGNIELVELFWNAEELPSFPIVPDALIYADLVGSGNERNLEIAARLKKRIVDHVASEAA